MRYRFNDLRYRALLILACSILLSPLLHAEEAWLERSREILESTRQQPIPVWLKDAMQPKADVGEFKKPELRDLGMASDAKPSLAGPMTYIFVSQSLGQEALREIMHENRGRKDRVIVFRGFQEGQSLKGFIGGFRSLIQGLDRKEIPAMTIDPERFTQFGITQVPAIVMTDGKDSTAQVSGIHEPAWLDRQRILSPGIRDFGVRGETVAISEPDLLLLVKERFQRFDWANYQKNAQTDFWQSTHFESLPQAQKDREFQVDPTFTVSRDIRNTQGHLIAIAGQRVNPLGTFPFRQKLIVFNGTRPEELEVVERELKADLSKRVTLIFSEMDRGSGWRGLQNIQQQLGSRVFILTPDLRKRFKLEATPSVIEAKDQQFRVREFGMGRKGS
jgi:conjugal transfer pilus assembly protein TraW